MLVFYKQAINHIGVYDQPPDCCTYTKQCGFNYPSALIHEEQSSTKLYNSRTSSTVELLLESMFNK